MGKSLNARCSKGSGNKDDHYELILRKEYRT